VPSLSRIDAREMGNRLDASRHSGIFPPVSTQINHGSALNRVPDEIFTHEYPQQETLDITSWQAYK